MRMNSITPWFCLSFILLRLIAFMMVLEKSLEIWYSLIPTATIAASLLISLFFFLESSASIDIFVVSSKASLMQQFDNVPSHVRWWSLLIQVHVFALKAALHFLWMGETIRWDPAEGWPLPHRRFTCTCIYRLHGEAGEMFGGSVCGPSTLFPDAIPQDFTASLCFPAKHQMTIVIVSRLLSLLYLYYYYVSMIYCLENETARQNTVACIIIYHSFSLWRLWWSYDLIIWDELINSVMLFHDAQLSDSVVKVNGEKARRPEIVSLRKWNDTCKKTGVENELSFVQIPNRVMQIILPSVFSTVADHGGVRSPNGQLAPLCL